MTELAPIVVRPRERAAVLNSLAAGVVPAIGLPLIQVGRNLEVRALVADLLRVEEGGAAVRFVIGRFGTGKSFLLNLVRMLALERGHLVMHADVTPDRRFHSSGDHPRALYTELLNNTCTKASPTGGGLPAVVERFVLDVAGKITDATPETAVEAVTSRLSDLRDMTMGSHFVRVLAAYVQGYAREDARLVQGAMRWLRAEYSSKSEARQDIGVREIIGSEHLYPMLKVWAAFSRHAGFKGLLVNFDELVVLSERLNHRLSREKNYEMLLVMLNDCLQGRVGSLGLCFAGTDEFLENRQRGLSSYEALRTRLSENPFAVDGLVDMSGPVIRLQTLTPEELYMLLEKVALVHALGDPAKMKATSEDISSFVRYKYQSLGAASFLTPRESIRDFVSILNLMDQHAQLRFRDILERDSGKVAVPPPESSASSVLRGFNLGGP